MIARCLTYLCVLSCVASAAADESVAPTAAALAATIDGHLNARLQQLSINAAARCDDATFLRRVYLDLTGCIPSSQVAREFLQDKTPDKRTKLVGRLLNGAGYVRHFTAVWRTRWLQQPDQPQIAALVPGFDRWLHDKLRENAPYDVMVRELLVPERRQPQAIDAAGTPPAPGAFLQAIDASPEARAGATSRLLLGLNVDCAQCHNHPFARWSQQQFWNYAAFFAVPQPQATTLTLMIPGTEKQATPQFLDGTPASLSSPLQNVTGRDAVATWVTARNNPYFARNAVNRTWDYFFGSGLVEPLDDLSGAVPASHPAMLDSLSAAFIDSGFDVRLLVQAITLSDGYQRSTVSLSEESPPEELFAGQVVRTMTGEQLYDSLLTATGTQGTAADRAQFVAAFGRPDRPAQTQRTILQALHLMNGPLVADAASIERSQTLRAVAEAPFMTDSDRLDSLFLSAFSRFPTSAERQRLADHLQSRTQHPANQGLADVFWVLLNSAEFGTIH